MTCTCHMFQCWVCEACQIQKSVIRQSFPLSQSLKDMMQYDIVKSVTFYICSSLEKKIGDIFIATTTQFRQFEIWLFIYLLNQKLLLHDKPPTDVSFGSDSLSIIIERVQIIQTTENMQSYLDVSTPHFVLFLFPFLFFLQHSVGSRCV